MEIHIDDNRKINEIQEEFNHKYPYIKLEFFSKPHGDHEGSAVKDMLPGDSLIRDIRTIRKDGDIMITPVMKVNDIERLFEESFGLHIQVFRKAGDVWLETTVTDDWTLAEQNEHGKSRSEY